MGKLTDLVHCFDDSVFFQLPGAAVSADGDAVGIGIGQAEEIIGQDAVEIPEVDEDTLGKGIRGDCKVKFLLNGEKPLAVYAYCNLHGLWKVEL